ncbi:iron ABC transporter permease [Cardiobacteriaceae bacterium TAE3-ERU3]|nr:iron ABC transporter permease [Cardiobacteriaceae bacterium TAE3-ERU3]
MNTTATKQHIFSAFDGRIAFSVPVLALWILVLLIAAIVAVLVTSLMSGSYPLAVREVLQTLFGEPVSGSAETVVWSFRFPRALVAILVGMLLALSGATLQNVTRNPLADPSLVGVSQGAGLAVVSMIVIFPDISSYYRPLAAFGGALVVAALIQWMSIHKRGGDTMRFILTGIGVAAFISALTSAMLTYGDLDRALSALAWLAGSVHSAGWDEVAYLSICTMLLLPVLFWASRPMMALRMGDELAVSFGVRVRLIRVVLITLSVALAAVAVAAVGPLGFVGLVAPHVARRIAHAGVGLHLALSAAVGALLVSGADLIGRIAFAPVQIPAGLVTAMIGVPIFIALILRGQAKSEL